MYLYIRSIDKFDTQLNPLYNALKIHSTYIGDKKHIMTKQFLKYTFLFSVIVLLHSSCNIYLFDIPNQTTLTKLKEIYAVNLNATWTDEKAELLLATLDSIYQHVEGQNPTLHPSVWKISDEEIQDDIKIEIFNSLKLVTISSDVFAHEDTEAELEANKKLFRVVAQFITENWTDVNASKLLIKDGSDRNAVEMVLKEMYGLSIVFKDTPEAEKIAQKLHKYVGKIYVTEFTNKELIMLMAVYDLFPRGLDKIPKMKYLLRRQEAPYAGSAWIVADCIEYDARTFRINNQSEFKRIIIHEKAHFLWEYALNGKLRKNWSELGGWHKDPNNKNRWLKSKSRNEFVTDYAYAKNPNEDWAESVAFYLSRPNKLRACSLAKYEFIDSVMQQYQEGGVPFKRLQHLDN